MSLFNRYQFLEDLCGQMISIVVQKNDDSNTAFINFHNAFYKKIDKYALADLLLGVRNSLNVSLGLSKYS